MMNRLFAPIIVLTALVFISSSCSEKILGEPGVKVAVTFRASLDESAGESKSAISPDGTKIYWQSGDALTIWDGSAKNVFTATPTALDASQAVLAGEVTSGSTSFTSVYPEIAGRNCAYAADAVSGIVIPQTQTANSGTYDPSAAVMTAFTDGSSLAFKNVCSFLKIAASAEYTRIVVSVTEGNITGTFTVRPTTGIISGTTSGNKSLTLVPSEGSSVIAVGTYYLAIAPGTIESLTVDCYTDETSFVEKSKSGTMTFERSKVYDLGTTQPWTQVMVSSITLDKTTADALVGGTVKITPTVAPANAANKNLVWSSSNPSVATVSDGIVTCIDGGVVNITAKSTDGGDVSAVCKVTVTHAYVDLALPSGTKWATCNIGAVHPQDEGLYFAWGSTTGRTSDVSDGYSYDKTPEVELQDGNLKSAYDAATVNWGSDWCMPTQAQLVELKDNTYNGWTDSYNNTGICGSIYYKKVSGKTSFSAYSIADAHIFLPAAGDRLETYHFGIGWGYYWSRTLYLDGVARAYRLNIRPTYSDVRNYYRYYGFNIRPVRVK